VHLAQRDVSFAAISRAPLSKLEAFKKRMSWMFNWVSSYANILSEDWKQFVDCYWDHSFWCAPIRCVTHSPF